MAFPLSFRELQSEIYPRWAQAPRWAQFISAKTQQLDDMIERYKRTIGARLIEKAPDDALGQIGGNCYLPKPRTVALPAYRAYLRRPFERWYYSSTPLGLEAELAFLGYSLTRVITYQNLRDGGFPASTFGGFSSFFYVLIKPPHPWAPPGNWDGGADWDAAPYTWDSTAKVEEIDEIRRVIRWFKPAGMSCRYIEVWLTVDIFGVPTSIVRWPVHEDWELGPTGAAKSFYNQGFEKE